MPKLNLTSFLITGIAAVFSWVPLTAQIDTSLSSKKDSTISVMATLGVRLVNENPALHKANIVEMQYVNRHPYISLQQLVKAAVAGVYVQ